MISLLASCPFSNLEERLTKPFPVVHEKVNLEKILYEVTLKQKITDSTRFYIVRHSKSEGKNKNLVGDGDENEPSLAGMKGGTFRSRSKYGSS